MGVAAYPVIAAGGGYSLYKGHQYANPQDPYAAPPGGVSPLFSPPTQKATSKARKSSKPKPKSKLPVDNYPKAKPRMRSKNRNEE